MKIFHCDRCQHLLFFENTQCVACGGRIAFDPGRWDMTSLSTDANGASGATGEQGSASVAPLARCRNDIDYDVCNWGVADGDDHELCRSCRLTTVIPDTSVAGNVSAWYKVEVAKRRLIFTLLTLGLPVVPRTEDTEQGLAFEFKSDPPDSAAPRVLTGHADGVITINIAEADDAEREKRRQGLGEPYRTLLGHMRHESGHYYWDRLVQNTSELEGFRALFGDERRDYAEALRAHYDQGAPADWQARYVTTYASSHPWEDWAETWAHYLHMVDALETAAENGIELRPRRADEPAMRKVPAAVTRGRVPFDLLIDRWFPLTYVLNNLNRGLGLADSYPFVLPKPAVDKLRFVHDVIARSA